MSNLKSSRRNGLLIFDFDDCFDKQSREYIINTAKIIAKTTQTMKDILQILNIVGLCYERSKMYIWWKNSKNLTFCFYLLSLLWTWSQMKSFIYIYHYVMVCLIFIRLLQCLHVLINVSRTFIHAINCVGGGLDGVKTLQISIPLPPYQKNSINLVIFATND